MAASWSMFVDIMDRLLEEAAYAVRRYAQVSGEDPARDMPEFFVPSIVLERLGTGVTFTLESNASKLLEWDRNARDLAGAPGPDDVLALKTKLGRVDMVVYGPAERKDKVPFLALVEFKKSWPSVRDRNRVVEALELLPTCPFGATVTVVDQPPDQRDLVVLRARFEAADDTWLEKAVPPLPLERPRAYTVCAVLFRRGAKLLSEQ